jgi:hypothetical protein
MSTTCPNGHVSQTSDYCDHCGTRLQKPVEAAVAEPVAAAPVDDDEVSPDTAPSPPSEPCPDCRTPRVGSDKFCEQCGFNFATRESAGAGPPASPAALDSELWTAVVVADREYYDRVTAAGVEFPAHYQARRFVLEQDEIGIGRHSASRGIRPHIDLSGAPEDDAISHLHAILLRQQDGSYALMDPGSSNGTTLNDDPTPLTANTPVPLAAGDRIHVGAWTTLTIRRGES